MLAEMRSGLRWLQKFYKYRTAPLAFLLNSDVASWQAQMEARRSSYFREKVRGLFLNYFLKDWETLCVRVSSGNSHNHRRDRVCRSRFFRGNMIVKAMSRQAEAGEVGRGGWLFGNDAASTRLPQGAATLAGIAAAGADRRFSQRRDNWRYRSHLRSRACGICPRQPAQLRARHRTPPLRDLVMIAAHLPSSKLETARRFAPGTATSTLPGEFGLPENENHLSLAGRASESHVALPRSGALVLLTSTWSRCCPLVHHGHSRDGKKGLPQVEFGLLCDRDGWPVAIEAWQYSVDHGRAEAAPAFQAGRAGRRHAHGRPRGPEAQRT